MIAKLESISYIKNALAYYERGGVLISTNKCLGNSDEIYQQILINNQLNDRCKKHTFHIKIRIAPEDKGKLNTQDWIDVSNDYAEKMRFIQNPFAVYIHEEDTGKEHIHIVASRIQANNLVVKDNFTYYKNMDFCRYTEKKYKLRSVERVLEKVKAQKQFISNDKRLLAMKEKIVSAINQSDDMNDFSFHLQNMGITIKKGRGLSFIDKDGVKFKGSAIDRKYSLKGIEKMLSFDNHEKNNIKYYRLSR